MKPLYSHGALLSLPVLSLGAHTSTVPQAGKNTLGATIFFAYILAALYLTGYLVLNIVRHFSTTAVNLDQVRFPVGQPRKNHDGEKTIKENFDRHPASQNGKRKTWAKYFAGLALISFTLLSYNMLSFLVVSYLMWAESYADYMRINLSSVHPGQWASSIWKWATNSNLFRTFAEDLIQQPQAWFVVQLALLYSYTWNIWMGTIGYELKIRSLGSYFLLDQILPISFTQNLFCTTVMLEKVQPQTLHASTISTLVKLVVTFTYVVILSCISATVGTPWFFLAIFSLRIILFAPYFLDREASYTSKTMKSGGRHSIRRTNIWCMLMLVGYGLLVAMRAQILSDEDSKPIEFNYAAAALRHDLTVGVVGSVSFIIAPR